MVTFDEAHRLIKKGDLVSLRSPARNRSRCYGGRTLPAVVSGTASHGRATSRWLRAGFLNRERFIPFPMPLCRHSSAIRTTECLNERSSESEEGGVSNHDPYSDRQLTLWIR